MITDTMRLDFLMEGSYSTGFVQPLDKMTRADVDDAMAEFGIAFLDAPGAFPDLEPDTSTHD